MSQDLASKKRDAQAIYRILKKRYPNVRCELNFKNPLQLLIATVLSAQCTDKRVNLVTKRLFKEYKKVEDFAGAKISDLEKIIKPTGFFRMKARNIRELSRKIIEDYGGKVPDSLNELVKLPGVGRKTANVVLGHAFGIPGITVDTHFGRLSRRFEWSSESDPVKVEFEVAELFPSREWTNLSQRMIWHGRRICHSRKPACGACPLAALCPSFGIGETDPQRAKLMVKSEVDFR
jgi:endonuclease-3